jgi:hypothetical protein
MSAFGEIAVHNNRLDKGSGIFGRYLFGHLARRIVGERRLLHTARESTDALTCRHEAAAATSAS